MFLKGNYGIFQSGFYQKAAQGQMSVSSALSSANVHNQSLCACNKLLLYRAKNLLCSGRYKSREIRHIFTSLNNMELY